MKFKNRALTLSQKLGLYQIFTLSNDWLDYYELLISFLKDQYKLPLCEEDHFFQFLYLMFLSDTHQSNFTEISVDLSNQLEQCSMCQHWINKHDNKKWENILSPFVKIQYDQRIIIFFKIRIKEFEFLKNYLSQPSLAAWIPDSILKNSNLHQSSLDYKQKEILNKMLTQNRLLIHGGPGTGKTTLLAFFMEIILNNNLELQFHFLAFTGKAVSRIREAIYSQLNQANQKRFEQKEYLNQIQISTIHRFLKTVENLEDKKFFTHFLIIDEISMVSLNLLISLFEKIHPQIHLFLIGDALQIPPIKGNNIFEFLNFYPQTRLPICSLTQNFRSENNPCLSQNLESIRNQINKELKEPSISLENLFFHHKKNTNRSFKLDQMLKDIPLFDVNWKTKLKLEFSKGIFKLPLSFQNYNLIYSFIEKFTHTLCENIKTQSNISDEKMAQRIVENTASLKILSPFNQGLLGVDDLNYKVAQMIEYKSQHSSLPPFKLILNTKNRFTLSLYNGDIGVQLGKKYLFYNAQNRWIQLNYYEYMQYAFCLSIHKSQGSEFSNVILTLPPMFAQIPNISHIFYTALSRAKNSVLLLYFD